MLPGKVFRPEDVLRILRKRGWLVVVPWALIAAGTAVVARKLPDTYQSIALIQVVPPRVPGTIVPVPTTARLQERLQTIQQTILNRPRLETLIQDFNLYQKERGSGEIMQDVVDRMTKDIGVEPVKGEAFIVSFAGRDRRQVQQVAEKLASFFIDESKIDGARRAETNSDFVQQALDDSLRKLREVEERVKKYRMLYASELPEQMGSNQSGVQSMQQQLGLIIASIEADTNTRLALEREISNLEAGADPGGTSSPAPGTEATAAQRLEALQRELSTYKARNYSDSHPDVKRLVSAINVAKKEAEAEALRNPVAVGGAVSQTELNRRRRLADRQQELEDVKKRIASKQQVEKQLRDAASGYQARVDRAPSRSAEMMELTREYDVLKKNYENMLNNREQASLSVTLERRQIGEQFILLDPARVPERPTSPNRPLINIFGIAAGLAFGLGLVALFEYRDHSFKTDTELGAYVALPVLAVVPVMMTGKEEKKAFRQRVLLHASCGSTVLICVALLTYTFVR
jgi:polysaccharide chain length determinant protein (PEP-CTERM system associated)